MTVRRKTWPRRLWLGAALVATPLSLAIGWCWNRTCDPEYVATARVSVPPSIVDHVRGTNPSPIVEDSVLSPEVIAAAADLLQERGISLPFESRPDSEIDYLLGHLDAAHERDGDRVEVELRYHTTDAEKAVPVLTAVVDSGIRALQGLVPEVADPGADDRNRERAQLAQALEQQQIRVAELQERLASRNREPLDALPSAESLRALASALEEGREHRIEAEDHLALACQEIRAGVGVEQIVARLPESSAWSETRDVAGTIRMQDELRQLEIASEAAAAVYGRNHPRMIGLQTQLEQTRQKLAARPEHVPNVPVIQASSSTDPNANSPSSAPTTAVLLLTALEEKCRQATRAEQNFERKLASATAAREEQQVLEPQLADARGELAFLQKEHERVRQEIVAMRCEAENRRVKVSEPPTLSPEPIVPPLAQHLLWPGIAGMLISGGLLRGFQRSPERPVSPADDPYRTRTIERSKSREEDNLARLRRLKPVA